jgi:hypothetical protein
MEQNIPISQNTIPLNIINNLDDLKILLFWQIIRDGNIMLLDLDYQKDTQYSEEEKQFVTEIWYKLYDAYYSQTDDSRSKHELKKSSEELFLSYRIKRLNDFCELLGWLSNMQFDLSEDKWYEMYHALVNSVKEKEPRIKLNVLDDPLPNFEKIARYMASLHNQLKKLTTGKQKSADSAVSNIYTKVGYVSVELGIQLNVKEMSCNEWLAYQGMASQRQAAKLKQNKKNK